MQDGLTWGSVRRRIHENQTALGTVDRFLKTTDVGEEG